MSLLHEYTKELFNWQKTLKMINKTNCWLLAVFVDFQFTPWHKIEVLFNGNVQQCPLCLGTVRTPMHSLDSFFLECLDKLVSFPSRQLQATIKCPLCRTSFPVPDADTFDNLPSSFRRDQLVEAPILEASTKEKCDTCGWNNPTVIYCSVCQRVLCPTCFKFDQRFKKSSKCFDRRTTRARITRRDREINYAHLFILYIYLIICCVYYLMTQYKTEEPKPGVNAV